MRVVLDTNVVFSGLLCKGTSHRFLSAIRRTPETRLFTSAALFEELADVLSRPHSLKRLATINKTAKEVLDDYASIVEFVQPAAISPASADPDDDAVLACALAAGADLIASGDPHLLNLKRYHGIEIGTPAAASERVGA